MAIRICCGYYLVWLPHYCYKAHWHDWFNSERKRSKSASRVGGALLIRQYKFPQRFSVGHNLLSDTPNELAQNIGDPISAVVTIESFEYRALYWLRVIRSYIEM